MREESFTMYNPLRVFLRSGWIAVLLLILSVWGALAQGIGNNFVPGEMIVSFPAGTARASVDSIVGTVNTRVVMSYGQLDTERRWDVYYIRSKDAKLTPQGTLDAIALLKKDARVKYAGANNLGKFEQSSGASVTPNDPLYGQEWGLRMIRMPQAWTLTKGKTNVPVVISDT